MSVYVKAEGDFVGRYLYTYTGSSWYKFEGGTLESHYKRFWLVAPVETSSGGPFTVSVKTLDPGVFYVHSPQIENKEHITDFVYEDRQGVVKDYSGNGNHAALELSTTPKWSNTSKEGNGSYEFDEGSIITLPFEMNNSNYGRDDAQYTFSMWVYLNKHNNEGLGLILGMAYYDGFGIMISSDGNTFTEMCTYFRNSVAMYSTQRAPLNLNQWYHIVAVLDKPNTTIKFYLDGILFAQKSISKDGFTYENHPFAINRRSQPGGNGPWSNISGLIDDVRIYNRALSEEEIKYQYDMAIYKK